MNQSIDEIKSILEKSIQMNDRLSLLLGYAMGFISNSRGKNDEQYKWLMNAIENLIYVDKPLPPMP